MVYKAVVSYLIRLNGAKLTCKQGITLQHSSVSTLVASAAAYAGLIIRPGEEAHWCVQTNVDGRTSDRERESLSLTMKYTNIFLIANS
jgi:hypothetical protein